MVFIILAVFLTRYYWGNIFCVLFGPKICFMASDAYQFHIIAWSWHQSIIIDHRNPFIYVFMTLTAFMTRYYWEMVFLALFGAQNRDFRALDAYRFDIIPCHWYQTILIDHNILMSLLIFSWSFQHVTLIRVNFELCPRVTPFELRPFRVTPCGITRINIIIFELRPRA